MAVTTFRVVEQASERLRIPGRFSPRQCFRGLLDLHTESALGATIERMRMAIKRRQLEGKMKTGTKLNVGKEASATAQTDDRKTRMAVYLEKTRPTFMRALVKSRELGSAANGVLAGPTVRIAK